MIDRQRPADQLRAARQAQGVRHQRDDAPDWRAEREGRRQNGIDQAPLLDVFGSLVRLVPATRISSNRAFRAIIRWSAICPFSHQLQPAGQSCRWRNAGQV